MQDFRITVLKQTRENTLALIDGLSLEQINKVPDGFKNSIGWNIAHMLVTQQLLCYKLSGNPVTIDSSLIEKYRKGTTHDTDLTQEEFSEISTLLLSSVHQLQKDIDAGIFKEFNNYESSFKVTLHSFDEACTFNNAHETLHMGYILAMRHLV